MRRRISTVLGAHVCCGGVLDTYSHLWPDSDDRKRVAVDPVLGSSVSQTCLWRLRGSRDDEPVTSVERAEGAQIPVPGLPNARAQIRLEALESICNE